MEMSLKNREWEEFKLKDIFSLTNGICSSFEKIKSKN